MRNFPASWPFSCTSASPVRKPPAGRSFEKRCGGCHALDRDKEGPALAGVYGRAAGSVASFQYSPALQKSKLTWTSETLDKWLTDPDKLVPNNDMSFSVPNSDERKRHHRLPEHSARPRPLGSCAIVSQCAFPLTLVGQAIVFCGLPGCEAAALGPKQTSGRRKPGVCRWHLRLAQDGVLRVEGDLCSRARNRECKW